MANIEKKILKQEMTLFDKVITKIERSTSTVDELRIAMWAPIEKISKASTTYKDFIANKNVRKIKTSWGEVEVRNRLLTQTHKDIFDGIFTCRKNEKHLEDGRVAMYFSLYQLQQLLGIEPGKNNKWLKQKIEEIADARIKYVSSTGDEFSFGIFAEVAYSEVESSYGVIFSNLYLQYFTNSLTINYGEYVSDIASINDALIKAIIKFFLTHDARNYPFRISFNELIKSVGYPTDSPNQIKQARASINKNRQKLEEYCIYYDKQSSLFEYHGKENIQFTKPLKLEYSK